MMRRMILLGVAMLLAVSGATVFAQGVYVIQTDKGPVFTDKPQAGSKEVSLRPLSVVPSVKESKTGDAAAAAPAKPAVSVIPDPAAKPDIASVYSRLSILEPADNGSVVANTGVFEVRLAVDPALRLGDGHSFVVRINGRTVAQRFTAAEFLIPAEFWAEGFPPANQMVQLDASVVDAGGQVLVRAQPVRFFMRYVTVHNQPHLIVPRPVIRPQPPVNIKPKAVPAPASGYSAEGLVGRKD